MNISLQASYKPYECKISRFQEFQVTENEWVRLKFYHNHLRTTDWVDLWTQTSPFTSVSSHHFLHLLIYTCSGLRELPDMNIAPCTETSCFNTLYTVLWQCKELQGNLSFEIRCAVHHHFLLTSFKWVGYKCTALHELLNMTLAPFMRR